MAHVQNAAIYTRISDARDTDKDGAKRTQSQAGVARQETDARALAARLGWNIGTVIVENDTSAFKRRKVTTPSGRSELRVVRPGFRQLLDLIDAGQIDGLVAYDLDRIARDPRDLEDLIDAVESRKPRLPVESVTGSLRLANDADTTMARVMVAVNNKSSRDTARRVARKHEESALAGKYAGGPRRFGYEKDGVTLRELEAEVIRQSARRVLAGETVSSIARSLNEAGVPTAKNGAWSNNALTHILRSSRIAGLRVHRGEVVGEAEWPAIVDLDTHEALLATLEARSRGRGKPALIHWCNYLLWCSHCGNRLSGTYMRADHYTYACRTNRGGCGRIAIHGPKVEAEVERQVLDYLTRPDVMAALASGRSESSAEETRKAISEDEAQLKELSRMWANKRITLEEYSEARSIIEARLEAARGALMSVVPERVRAVVTAKDQAAAWTALEPRIKREVAQAILRSGGFKGWTVAPHDKSKGAVFDNGRLSLTRDDA